MAPSSSQTTWTLFDPNEDVRRNCQPGRCQTAGNDGCRVSSRGRFPMGSMLLVITIPGLSLWLPQMLG